MNKTWTVRIGGGFFSWSGIVADIKQAERFTYEDAAMLARGIKNAEAYEFRGV